MVGLPKRPPAKTILPKEKSPCIHNGFPEKIMGRKFAKLRFGKNLLRIIKIFQSHNRFPVVKKEFFLHWPTYKHIIIGI